ncbi:conjugative transposon TraM protein [Pontibacter mucosus]|uniref:Conjugative transposon TraM protein n=1 Tax=Pontibacter mucosus TaxID=1649266 RepID=A0A2T5YEG4_9BACT|nr:conjugative transposon protein TraM [Pontibacter mucosus]PTX15102.1 conjugative transposon TraM protein [Pontibacter mucosus]
MNSPSDAKLRQRKFFLVLPLLVLPFLTMAFWALGGGQGTPFRLPDATGIGGLSLSLPDPQFKHGKGQDKLSLYEQARRSLPKQVTTLEEQVMPEPGIVPPEAVAVAAPDLLSLPAASPEGAAEDAGNLSPASKEEAIDQRLAQLSALAAGAAPAPKAIPPVMQPIQPNARFSQDVDRLEAMMQRMASPGAPNPEMQQMEALLERILDIQHPERLKGQAAEQAPQEPPPALAVAGSRQAAITLLGASEAPAAGFHTMQASPPLHQVSANTVEAVIPTTQTLTAGALVRLRLVEDLQLEGRLVPRGSLLYGTCRLRGERLTIEINSVLFDKTTLTVALTAYDLDGQEGIFIPGAHAREAARQGAGRALQQSLQLPSLSPSLGAQATGAGIAAARDMISRQTRQVKVTLKAGHRLLLQNR